MLMPALTTYCALTVLIGLLATLLHPPVPRTLAWVGWHLLLTLTLLRMHAFQLHLTLSWVPSFRLVTLAASTIPHLDKV